MADPDLRERNGLPAGTPNDSTNHEFVWKHFSNSLPTSSLQSTTPSPWLGVYLIWKSGKLLTMKICNLKSTKVEVEVDHIKNVMNTARQISAESFEIFYLGVAINGTICIGSASPVQLLHIILELMLSSVLNVLCHLNEWTVKFSDQPSSSPPRRCFASNLIFSSIFHPMLSLQAPG